VIAALVAIEAFAVGAIAGSILSSAAYRVPRHLSMFTTGRSRCDRCAVTIRWRDLVPVVSWFALGGRCRTCHAPISPRYAYTEIGLGLAGGVSAAVAVHQPATGAIIAVAGLLALALTTARWRSLNARGQLSAQRNRSDRGRAPQHGP
jgi:leader peptidase (prepilin peptidase)/N-methyltransferase